MYGLGKRQLGHRLSQHETYKEIVSQPKLKDLRKERDIQSLSKSELQVPDIFMGGLTTSRLHHQAWQFIFLM